MTRAQRIKQIADTFEQHVQKRDYTGALKVLESLTRERWSDNELLFSVSKTMLVHLERVPDEWKYIDELKTIMRLMLRKAGDNPGVIGMAAYFYAWYAHDFIEVYSLYDRLFVRASDKLEWGSCYSAAMICDQLRAYDKMEEWLQRAELLACDDLAHSNLVVLRAVHSMNNGDPETAIALLHGILSSQPGVARTNLARAYLIAGDAEQARYNANIALTQDRSIVNLMNISFSAYRQGQYEEAIDYAREILDMVEISWYDSSDSIAIERQKQLQKSKQTGYATTEAFKCLIKACLKLGKREDATIYLHRAKSLFPNADVWQDIEDMWPNDSAKIDDVITERYAALLSQYPGIPDKAVWCIARAETISEFLSNPALWYDTICRDHGMAFEIILRNIVCKDSRTMNLQELVDYISSAPGDPLYGGNELLHRLRRIRNNVSHEPIASAEDVERSRRILFEEVLAKL